METTQANMQHHRNPESQQQRTPRDLIILKLFLRIFKQISLLGMISFLIFTLVLSFLFTVEQSQRSIFDSCAIDRFSKDRPEDTAEKVAKSTKPFKLFGLSLFQISIFNALVCVLCLLVPLHRSKKQQQLIHGQQRSEALDGSLISSGATATTTTTTLQVFKVKFEKVLCLVHWYYCSYSFVTFLKHYINDHACNRHANSVSGHFNFYVFMLTSLPVVFFHLFHYEIFFLKKPVNQLYSIGIFAANYASLLVCSVMVLYETYFGGYHSLRQIIYGFTFALISHCLFDFLFLTTYEAKSGTAIATPAEATNASSKRYIQAAVVAYLVSNSLLIIYDQFLAYHTHSRVGKSLTPSSVTLAILTVFYFVK